MQLIFITREGKRSWELINDLENKGNNLLIFSHQKNRQIISPQKR